MRKILNSVSIAQGLKSRVKQHTFHFNVREFMNVRLKPANQNKLSNKVYKTKWAKQTATVVAVPITTGHQNEIVNTSTHSLFFLNVSKLFSI